MIQRQTILKVADNTGAKRIMCIGIPGRGNTKTAIIGDVITVTVKRCLPFSTVKKGQVVQALIVRTRKEKGRQDGTYIRFDDNAAVLVKKESKDPLGTRVFGPVAREVRERGYNKIASLAPEVW